MLSSTAKILWVVHIFARC